MAIHESGATWCTDEQHTNCMCDQSDITCNGQPRFTQIPNNIPTSTRRLRLGGNKITSIASVSSGITSLYKLDLSDNYISSIEPGAFSGFTSLFEIIHYTDVFDNNGFYSPSLTVDGEWGSWISTPCSTSCGNGSVYRKRRCDSPAPSKGGQMCVGDNMEYLNACNLKNCPVDGQWSSWSSMSCSVSCGVGIKHRIRSCDNPKPSDDGKDCVGPGIESVTCNLGKCREWKKTKAGKWRRNYKRQFH
ncbi:HMCN [Mytilus edulis]|uniref:HMCN n=1 Tax=Mytilus edulis TaxID=6550 RepID=A0A8S3T1F7_MYTED|nr:HMCN [Mytilus edulis]